MEEPGELTSHTHTCVHAHTRAPACTHTQVHRSITQTGLRVLACVSMVSGHLQAPLDLESGVLLRGPLPGVRKQDEALSRVLSASVSSSPSWGSAGLLSVHLQDSKTGPEGSAGSPGVRSTAHQDPGHLAVVSMVPVSARLQGSGCGAGRGGTWPAGQVGDQPRCLTRPHPFSSSRVSLQGGRRWNRLLCSCVSEGAAGAARVTRTRLGLSKAMPEGPKMCRWGVGMGHHDYYCY